MKEIPVVEIFGPSHQGEGPNAGSRCIFVRVKGCDYSCSFCDSKFSWGGSSSEATLFHPEDLASILLSRCKENECYHVVLTGGNPCLYDFTNVLFELQSNEIIVDIETQGSLLPEWLRNVDTIVISPKGPTSNMPDVYNSLTEWLVKNNDFAKYGRSIAIKIPIFNQGDLEFARSYARFVNEFNRTYDSSILMYLSVGNSDVDTTESIRDRVLSDYENLLYVINGNPTDFKYVRVLPQIHTLIWGNKQGV
jgi:7-carboxy-7-deazaguanine synthase